MSPKYPEWIRDRSLLDAALRSDFELFAQRCFLTLNPGKPFFPTWHHRAIGHVLNGVRNGDITRLMINVQPRSLKSLIASVAYPAFVLGHNPKKRIYVISYGSDLADKHSSDFRSIVESNWYRHLFPNMQIRRSSETEIATTERGYRRSTTVMGSLTGMGGDVFILDDPQKAVDAQSEARRNSINQWFTNTLVSRLDNKRTGAIVIVMQRVHMNDLCGFLTDASHDWNVLNLPAIAEMEERIEVSPGEFHLRRAGEALHPEHEPIDVLRDLESTMGPDDFAAQFQQCPVPEGGAMIRREWLSYYDELPNRSHRTKIIQSWDTAAKDGALNDWSVCTTWLVQDSHYYLIDLVRDRFEYPQLRKTAIAQAQRHKPSVILIEDASTGIALAQELKKILHIPVKPVPIERDKRGRMYVHQETFFSRRVHFPKNAPYLAALERELLAFPQGKTDDQVDSISQALNYSLRNYRDSLIAAMR